MDKKLKLRAELKKKIKQEMSVTGTGASVTPGVGAGVATKYAFGKRTNKGTPKDWKAAPSIPNRPSKAMDYKELWEVERDQEVRIIKGPHAGNIATVHDFDSEKDIASGDDWVSVLIGNKKEMKTVKASELKPLKEGYAQFRNETKQRSKPDQFHQAVKQVKKKVNEINRLFEYMDRLKTELSEGEEELKYKKYTENALSQIKEATKKLFFKSTKLK